MKTIAERPTCAVHQPNLFPRISTLFKLYSADVWVVLDDVQFNARDYQNRAWLQSPDGTYGQWLTLATRRTGGRATRIKDVALVDPVKNEKRLLALVKQYYGRCRRWPHLRPIIERTAEAVRDHEKLAQVGELSTRLLLDDLGWHGTVVRSSSFTVSSERSGRLAELSSRLGARRYLCGTGGARYLDSKPFQERQIAVQYVTLPAVPLLRQRKNATALWWLSAVDWAELRAIFWTNWNDEQRLLRE